uniref:Thioredoxin-like protein 4A n=1 Tax=Pseudo-nitzschia australis TaxID=44445 RepID=A0A7S4AFQ5_9STRA
MNGVIFFIVMAQLYFTRHSNGRTNRMAIAMVISKISIYCKSCTTMFFYRNKHIMVDLGTGNNNKINWALADKQEMIDIIEMVYRGARKGRGLVVSPKDYSTKYQY